MKTFFIHFFCRTIEQIKSSYCKLITRYKTVVPHWERTSGPFYKGYFVVG